MPDIDIHKLATSVAEVLSEYVQNFISILIYPRRSIDRFLVDTQVSINIFIQKAITYASISVVVGLCLAKLIELPRDMPDISPFTVIGALFSWIISGLILHPFLKIFGARGSVISTIAVILYVIHTLHIMFIPIIALNWRIGGLDIIKYRHLLMPSEVWEQANLYMSWFFYLQTLLSIYYLIISWYLSQTLSVAHNIKSSTLMILAVLGPCTLIGLLIIISLYISSVIIFLQSWTSS
jgi:hypothetical protein